MEVVYHILGHPVGMQTFLLGHSLVGLQGFASAEKLAVVCGQAV